MYSGTIIQNMLGNSFEWYKIMNFKINSCNACIYASMFAKNCISAIMQFILWKALKATRGGLNANFHISC